ncbi:hypothetical protein AVEN_23692-1 [Araneus ventricosus]|uniref:DUF5641 domain-containing protein n=1 Tax=Araneus ventricosus TaxID=182803 RepID=A0A4Y2U6X3_ARAVE|nr:hypothetical protein AVEN_23692-1 [Araneus ventricosus]
MIVVTRFKHWELKEFQWPSPARPTPLVEGVPHRVEAPRPPFKPYVHKERRSRLDFMRDPNAPKVSKALYVRFGRQFLDEDTPGEFLLGSHPELDSNRINIVRRVFRRAQRIASKDGIVRAKIKTKSGIVIRPIRKLRPLELYGESLITIEDEVPDTPGDPEREDISELIQSPPKLDDKLDCHPDIDHTVEFQLNKP